MSTSIEFQKRISELVEESEIKKSDLPKTMGVDYRSLSNSLNYGVIPKPRILIRIADYFDIPINYLLGRSDDIYFNKGKTPSDFNIRFVFLCKEKEVTYYKVSQMCHFDKSYISRWLNKKYLPSLDLLDILCDYFEVSIDYLLGRTDDKN